MVMQARPMKRLNSGEKIKTVYEMPELNPASEMRWINNRLSENSFSLLRFLPSFDENGNEQAFMCEGSDANGAPLFADAFYQVEMTTLYKPGLCKKFISTLNPVDKRGTVLPASTQTVAGYVVGRFNYNVCVARMLKAKGYPINIPEAWIEKYERKVTNETKPQVVTIVQALAFTVDGIEQKSPNGAPIPVPGLFPFQSTALDSLNSMLKVRRDMRKPLSQENLNPNNDLFSCANGHTVQYLATPKPDKSNKLRPVYSLQASELCPIDAAQAMQIVKPWDKILTCPFIEDQIQLFIDWLGADVVDFGLSNTPFESYIPAAIRGCAVNIRPTKLKWKEALAMPDNVSVTMMAPKQEAEQIPMNYAQPVQAPAQEKPKMIAKPMVRITSDEEEGVEDVRVAPPPPPPAPVRQMQMPSPVKQETTAVPPGAGDFANNLMKQMQNLGKK